MQRPEVGAVYEHFKRDVCANVSDNQYRYKVLAIAEHTETGEDFVVYQALYYPFKIYARPLSMFTEVIAKGGVHRFTKMGISEG